MIEFYATLARGFTKTYLPPNVAYLLPASSWYKTGFNGPKLPDHCLRLAADSGGFAAILSGGYKYTPENYLDWLEKFRPVKPIWAATFDYTCVFGGPVKEYQEQTTDMAGYFFSNYRDASWALVPTIQGKTVKDYTNHVRQLAPLLKDMKRFYESKNNPEFRVGIGSLVKRPVGETMAIVSNMAAELPEMRFHLWGVKLNLLKSKTAMNSQVASIDSSVWFDRWSNGNHRWRASGMRKDEYASKVSLPSYIEKLNNCLDNDKQLTLF